MISSGEESSDWTMIKRVGVIYHPKIEAAGKAGEELCRFLDSQGINHWACSAWDDEAIEAEAPSTDLAVSVGGDGTILRAVRAISPWQIPILGVNLGHLGFMTELTAKDIMERLPTVLGGDGWVDERAMLEVAVSTSEKHRAAELSGPSFALNDVVLGHGPRWRVIYIRATINGAGLTTYKADGVIVATATGSTGYALAAGGPILYPQAQEIILKPISAHLTMPYALVLPATATVELEVHTDHEAMLSIDGQVESSLRDGDRVTVRRSSRVARFLRVHSPESFYSRLESRLRAKGSEDS